ncbi:MAG: homoserine kinase [Chloracidobacterium sp.]|nr:homoserine kinase [Chloracidobacterium sp.]
MEEIRVKAPATVANVVCGFDCLGFALNEPFDEMLVRKIDEPGVRIKHRDTFGLPEEPERNVAGLAALAILDAARADFGVEIEITKHIKPGSGIGSSSASACGAVVAINHLLGERFSKLELVGFAMEGEAFASGARHADNLAPCLFGGFTLVRTTDPLDIVELSFPKLWATVIHPQIEIRTSEARALLPQEVPLRAAIVQWANVGALVAGLAKADLGLIGRSLEDAIVEPVRKPLIPNFDEVKAACLDAGALGGGISGSGPSLFMLSASMETAVSVEKAMCTAFQKTGILFSTYVSEIAREGIRVAASRE